MCPSSPVPRSSAEGVGTARANPRSGTAERRMESVAPASHAAVDRALVGLHREIDEVARVYSLACYGTKTSSHGAKLTRSLDDALRIACRNEPGAVVIPIR